MSVCDFNLTVASQPLSPEDHLPLMKMKYSQAILKDNFADFGGIDWFMPEVKQLELTGDLAVGQSIRIRFEDWENPFKSVVVSDVQYKAGETCPPVMDPSCATPCVSTAPTYRYCDVLFDQEIQTGASWCLKTERLTYGDLESRYRKNLERAKLVTSVQAWNKFVCDAVANPAATIIPNEVNCFPVHYIEAGLAAANGYKVLTDVIAYMKTIYGGMQDFAIFAHRYFETDFVEPGSTFHNYQNTGIPTAWGNVDMLVQGGFKPMPTLPGGLWGEKILIAPDSVALYDGTANYNPFMNDDGTKYYVVITSKRAFFSGVEPLAEIHSPATCDNQFTESWQQFWLTYNKILFPNEVFVIAFDVNC